MCCWNARLQVTYKQAQELNHINKIPEKNSILSAVREIIDDIPQKVLLSQVKGLLLQERNVIVKDGQERLLARVEKFKRDQERFKGWYYAGDHEFLLPGNEYGTNKKDETNQSVVSHC